MQWMAAFQFTIHEMVDIYKSLIAVLQKAMWSLFPGTIYIIRENEEDYV